MPIKPECAHFGKQICRATWGSSSIVVRSCQGAAPQERRPCDDDGKLSKGVCSSALHASFQPRPVASLARPRRPASIQHVPLVSSWLHGVGSRPDRLAHARATHMTCIPAGLLRWLPVCQRGCTWNAPGPAAGRSRSVCVCTCKTRPALALLFGAPRGRLGAAMWALLDCISTGDVSYM